MRVPPQSLDSERALLGAIMTKADVLHDILDTVAARSFYSEKHQHIFRSMIELHDKGEPIDVLSVSNRLKEKKLESKTGGSSYLTELLDSVPSAANAKHYADIVHAKGVLRDLIEAADDIADLGYDEAREIESVLDDAEKRVYSVTNISTSGAFVALKSTLDEAWQRIERLHNEDGDTMRGVPTGFQGLDDKLAGLQPSDLIILAARPSMGKTSLALDIARHSATKHNTKVGIFSLEMSSQQLVDRMISAAAQVDSWKLRTGKLRNDDEFANIQNALGELSKAPIYIDDEPGLNILKMRSVARKLKSDQGLDLIIVDYLQLIHPTKNYDSMVNQVTEISRALKNLAREIHVPVLALSQLSRAVEQRGGRPRLSDLRDSGSIEQDADVVMFIHREDKQDKSSDRPNIAEILIEKHRNGPTGMVELYFDEKRTSFVTIDKSGHDVAEAFESF